ncbi:MAG: hypothetical protein HY306_01780 [Nitrosomonadales bacterium]|nr:hypothetical protein [Nitrosomonadales bacterium]
MTAKSSTAKRKTAPMKPDAVKPEKKNRKDKNGKMETKVKVVRDSFTMPQTDYAKLAELKQALLKVGIHVKKSELLRAGLHALSKLGALQLKRAIAQIEQVKTGRPKKN